MEAAPYQRIVSDLRARVADGRLAPGDRVPSTRRLAKDWGVALATAAKALTVLCQEGLLQARPRAGTVVAPTASAAPRGAAAAGERVVAAPGSATSPGLPSGKVAPAVRAGRGPRSADGELSRERIVAAAIEIADAEGLDALSMRGVAAKLGVATMATYRYVASKDELVTLMADAAFGELDVPRPAPTGWRPLLERTGRTMWAVFRRHPWLAQVTPLSRPLPLRNLLAYGEQMFLALGGFDLDATARLDLQVMLYSHIQGLAAQLERETEAQAASGLTEDEWMARQGPAIESIVASNDYPRFAAVMRNLGEHGYDLDLDRIFELGLQTLLDGLEILLTRRGPGHPPAGPARA